MAKGLKSISVVESIAHLQGVEHDWPGAFTVLGVAACLVCDGLAGFFGDDFGIVSFVTLQAYLLANLKVWEKKKRK